MSKDYYRKQAAGKKDNYPAKNSINQQLPSGVNQQKPAKPFKLVDEERCRGKHIAGTYFEIATHNLFRTLDYILRRCGMRIANNWADEFSSLGDWKEERMGVVLKQMSALSLTTTQSSQLSRLMFHHFSFFAPLMADATDYVVRPFAKEVTDAEKKVNGINQKLEKAPKDIKLQQALAGATKRLQAARNALDRKLVFSSATEMLSRIAVMAESLNFYRNQYSHKNHYATDVEKQTQIERESDVAFWLEIILKGARNIIIDRGNHSQDDTKFLTQDGILHYNINKDKKSTRNPKFYFGPGIRKDKECSITDFGRFYFCSLFLRRSDAERFANESGLYMYSPFQLSESERQRLQTIENRRAAEEQKRVNEQGDVHTVNPRTIGDTESVQNNIVREMMDLFRIRIPRENRIDAVVNDGTLAMDILNELRRCPLPVFETFSPEDKATFTRIGVNPDGSKNETKLTRHEDRFAHLALRLIDQTHAFDDIRFHLRLGLFRYRFYDKSTVSGEPVMPVRTVHKEINGFGRWQEVEDLRLNRYSNLIQKRFINDEGLEQPTPDSTQTTPYITDWRTTYNIHAGRIGLAWGLNEMSNNGTYLPVLETEGEGKQRKAPIDMPAPMCYLSIYDLPALLFYQHIYELYHADRYRKNGILKAEEIIKNKYQALHDFFKLAASGASVDELQAKQHELGIADNEIPNKIRCFIGTKGLFHPDGTKWMSKEETEQRVKNWIPDDERRLHAMRILKELIEEDVFRIQSLDNKRQKISAGGRENRYGRKGRANIRPRAIARYLVESMMQWQPALSRAGGGKLTSANHRALVDYLADYGSNSATLDNLRLVLQRCALIDGEHPHPFINEVLKVKPENIVQLYAAYISAEKEKAENLLKKIGSKKEDVDLPPFARPEGMRWHTTLKDAADRYLHIPTEKNDVSGKIHDTSIMLPDGLFTPHIVALLRCALSENTQLEPMKDMLVDNGNAMGAAYLIRFWFDSVEHDTPQVFYNNGGSRYRRFYKTLSLLDPHRKKNRQLICDYFNEAEIADKLKLVQKKNQPMLRETVIRAYELDKGQAQEIKKRHDAMLDMLHDVADTEKEIRRYRIQDISLFLAVRRMLVKMLSNNTGGNIEKNASKKAQEMHLHDFGFENDFDFLDNAKMEFKYKIGNTTITMPAMSFKNYGTIFRLLGDDRFEQLRKGLETMQKNDVTFNDLTSELATYDQLRSEIMRLAQQIEQQAFDSNGYLHDVDDERFFVSDKEGNATTLAVRNNFNSMVHLLSQYADVADFFTELRNAIAHNRYPKPYKDAKEKTRNPYSDDITAAGYHDVVPPTIFDTMKQILEDKTSSN